MNWMSLVGLALTGVVGWAAHRITKPKDVERAATVEKIAQGAAALLVVAFPNTKWPDLVKKLVDAILAANPPTTNKAAIERAAASALTDLGKNPNVTKGSAA